MDHLSQLGPLALGSRLKRISDRLMSQAASVYEWHGFDVQSRWFPMLSLLSELGEVTIGEASKALGVSQPAISQSVREMTQARWIESNPCPNDARRRRVRLNERGKALIGDMKTMWQSVGQAAEELCEEVDPNFMTTLSKLETALKRASLLQRIQSSESFQESVS